MRVDEMGLASALVTVGGDSTWSPRERPNWVNIPAVPAPPWPKRKFSPTTTASAPIGADTSISAKRSARMRENAFVKGTTGSSSTPSRSMSWLLRPMGVRTAGFSSGRRTAIGCGSKVRVIAARRRSAASSIARRMTAWCPGGRRRGPDRHHPARGPERQVPERLVAPHAGSSRTTAGRKPDPPGLATAASRPSAASSATASPLGLACRDRAAVDDLGELARAQDARGGERDRARGQPGAGADLVRRHGVPHRQRADRGAPQRGEVRRTRRSPMSAASRRT